MSPTRRLVARGAIGALVVLLVATGCEAASTTHTASPRRTVTSTPFPPGGAGVPSGYRIEQCSDLRGRTHRDVAVRLLVPSGYDATNRTGAGCTFEADIDRSMAIAFDVPETLADAKQQADRDVGTGGDGDVEHVRLLGAGAVLGSLRADLLTLQPYNDGLPLDVRISQVDGVRLNWIAPKGKYAATAAAWQRVSASVSLVHDDRTTCRSARGGWWLRPPIPQTSSMDFDSGVCHLDLRPGLAPLLRYAEVVPAPKVSLETRAARLRATPGVHSVSLERGVGRLGGSRADRLTWTVVRTKRDQYGVPPGAWRTVTLAAPGVQATWSATPAQWRQETDVAQRFFDSVRPVA